MSNELLNSLKESYPVDVYDLSISNIEDRKKKVVRFDTVTKAANFLGITPNHMYRYIGVGKQAVDKRTGNKYAVRKVV